MSLKYTIVWTVFFCVFCFDISAGCSPNPIFDNITTCDSFDDFLNAGNHPEWIDLVIQNKEYEPGRRLRTDGFKNFPNLKTLMITGVVKGMEEHPFRGLDKLESLVMEYNEIKQLPEPNLFEGLTSLERLEIKQCSLEAVPANYFRHMKNLKHLNLSINSISSLGDCAFCDLNNTVIILSHNLLHTFNAHKVLGTTSWIEGIELDNNNLTKISRFGQMFNLREAKFSNNYITEMDDEAFLNAPRLMLLEFTYNFLKEIPVTALPETIRSDEKFVLDINSNNFKCLEKEIRDKFTALRSLALVSNPWDCKCLEDIRTWVHSLNATFSCKGDAICDVHCTDYSIENKPNRFIKMS